MIVKGVSDMNDLNGMGGARNVGEVNAVKDDCECRRKIRFTAETDLFLPPFTSLMRMML